MASELSNGSGFAHLRAPVPAHDLASGDVAGLARHLLLRAGLSGAEIARVEALYPDPGPGEPGDHGISAGDPPNPWLLACSAARHLWRRATTATGPMPAAPPVGVVLSCLLDDPGDLVVPLVAGYVRLAWLPGIGPRPPAQVTLV